MDILIYAINVINRRITGHVHEPELLRGVEFQSSIPWGERILMLLKNVDHEHSEIDASEVYENMQEIFSAKKYKKKALHLLWNAI